MKLMHKKDYKFSVSAAIGYNKLTSEIHLRRTTSKVFLIKLLL